MADPPTEVAVKADGEAYLIDSGIMEAFESLMAFFVEAGLPRRNVFASAARHVAKFGRQCVSRTIGPALARFDASGGGD